MEAISFGIGVASIASIFQTCMHGYRTLNTALRVGDDALTLAVAFQIEEKRLVMWGVYWGLVKEEVEKEEHGVVVGGGEDSGSDEEGKVEMVTLRVEGERERRKRGEFDDVDEDLGIPGLRDVAIEVLGRIYKGLEEWKVIAARYSPHPASITELSGTPKESSKDLLSKIAAKQEVQRKEISKGTRLLGKIRWALKDKQELDEILVKLTRCNDGLESLLPRRERESLERGLLGELLLIVEMGGLEIGDIEEQLGRLRGRDEFKAARVVLLKLSNRTEKNERARNKKSSLDPANEPTPFAKQPVWIKGTPGAMQIPNGDFIKLVEPTLEHHQIYKGKGRFITACYAPIPRSRVVYSPTSPSAEGHSSKTQVMANAPAQVAIIEWRPAAHESEASELTEQELLDRRDHIARLLHRTSTTDSEFRILDCLGYTTAAGHPSEGPTQDLVGYVYRYPDFASRKSLPVSLRDILGRAYASEKPKIPALDTRFKLARSLAIALYQLQCAGWVHRKISSYNVIFFRDRSTGELDLSQPFMMGWQYSRPDDERRQFPSEQGSAGVGDLDMYVHRKRLLVGGRGKFPRFRKSFDIYSLGIILMEIAFWEPIVSLTTAEERERMENNQGVASGYRKNEWWKAICRAANEDLAAKMGIAYRDAVLYCLQESEIRPKKETFSTVEEDRDPSDSSFVDEDFEEIGIAREFYREVLKPLESFGT